MKVPFIPDTEVQVIAMDSRYAESSIAKSITSLGIKLLPVFPCHDTYESIACHPDIQFHPLDDDHVIVAPNAHPKTIQSLIDLDYHVITGETPIGAAYPGSIPYNVGRIGQYAFHDYRYTDPVLKRQLEKRGVKLVQVKQGYTKCSMAILNQKTFITQDQGIYKAGVEAGLETLLIRPGHIILIGQTYGFIGGTAGLLNSNQLAITGLLNEHPDQFIIENFVHAHNVQLIYLSHEHCVDIGTLIPMR